jgi:hypothetical protein
MPAKKKAAKKAVKMRDLKPSKDAKGGSIGHKPIGLSGNKKNRL